MGAATTVLRCTLVLFVWSFYGLTPSFHRRYWTMVKELGRSILEYIQCVSFKCTFESQRIVRFDWKYLSACWPPLECFLATVAVKAPPIFGLKAKLSELTHVLRLCSSTSLLCSLCLPIHPSTQILYMCTLFMNGSIPTSMLAQHLLCWRASPLWFLLAAEKGTFKFEIEEEHHY